MSMFGNQVQGAKVGWQACQGRGEPPTSLFEAQGEDATDGLILTHGPLQFVRPLVEMRGCWDVLD